MAWPGAAVSHRMQCHTHVMFDETVPALPYDLSIDHLMMFFPVPHIFGFLGQELKVPSTLPSRCFLTPGVSADKCSDRSMSLFSVILRPARMLQNG